METFSALLAICARNSPVIGEFPAQRPVTRSFDVFFDLRPNKRLSKQSWVWWFETPLCPLWRQCNARRGQNYWATPISMSISITLTGMLIKLKFEAVSAITSSLEIFIHYNRAYCRMSNGESLYTFYPRPGLAFGYCHRLRLCVCVCVRVGLGVDLSCPRDKSRPVEARLVKFGPKMQNTYVKFRTVLGGKKSQNLPHFELVRDITHCPFKLGSTNLDQRWK